MAWLNVLGLIFNLVGSGIAAIGVIALERRSMRGVDVAAETGTVLGVGVVAAAAWVEHVLLEYLVRPIQTVGGTVKPGILAGLRSMSNWRPPSCCQFLA